MLAYCADDFIKIGRRSSNRYLLNNGLLLPKSLFLQTINFGRLIFEVPERKLILQLTLSFFNSLIPFFNSKTSGCQLNTFILTNQCRLNPFQNQSDKKQTVVKYHLPTRLKKTLAQAIITVIFPFKIRLFTNEF